MAVKARTKPIKRWDGSTAGSYTHRITIPGTGFAAWVAGEEAAEKLAAKLAKTSTGKVGRRTVKARPIIETLEASK